MEIIVASCLKYADAWGPFMGLFRKFWPDCRYRISISTDFGPPTFEGYEYKVLQMGADLGWSNNLYHNLNRIEADEVLLMQEDHFLNDKVDSDIVARALDILHEHGDVKCVRLMPCPGPDGPDWYYDDAFGEISIDAPYRVSCQAAIWQKDALQRILRTTHDAASFEIDGTIFRPEGKYLSVKRQFPFPMSYYVTAISRGLWEPDAVAHCIKNSVPIDTSKRGLRVVQGNEGQTT